MPSEEAPTTKRRRAWLAALISFLMPGLGQIYNVEYRKGTTFIAATAAWNCATASFFVFVPPVSPVVLACALAMVIVSFVIEVAATIDAWRSARRVGAVSLGSWNRWYIYLGLVIGIALASVGPHAIQRAHGQWQSYDIPSTSMLPNFVVGDHLTAWKNYYVTHTPARGDVVVFKLPRDNRTDYIKRIVGLPGERIRLHEGRLYINDALIPRARIDDYPDPETGKPTGQYVETLPNGVEYRILEVTDNGPLDETAERLIPEGHYFVLGDNRDNSLDSRVLVAVGYIPRSNLRDRPMLVYWNRDLSRIGTRY